MSCPHDAALRKLSPPTAFAKIYRDECVLCFRSVDSSDGLLVCLSCFQGNCINQHASLHFRKTGHLLYLHLKLLHDDDDRLSGKDQSAARKISRIEIQAEPLIKTHYEWKLVCIACEEEWSPDEISPSTRSTVESLLSSADAQRKLETQTWSEQPVACEHLKELLQSPDPLISHSSARHCFFCESNSNLWMCLVCGVIGCGRKQFDGSGGNGHAASHFTLTGHAASVKLGTISSGSADVNCYLCDEIRVDPLLAQHLSTFGIDIDSSSKTESSMAELQLEQNLKFDFSMVSQDGKEYERVEGPGMLGLKNLGNSCYMASTVQLCLTLPSFIALYGSQAGQQHVESCQRDATLCVICQSVKLVDGITSGQFNTSLSPWMFKAVVGNGHPEFSTARQQDASDFLSHYLRCLQRSDPASSNLVSSSTFNLQQKLECLSCGNQKFSKSSGSLLTLAIPSRTVSTPTLDDALAEYFAPVTVELVCEKCGGANASKSCSMTTTPSILVIQIARFVESNWVPQKLEMPLDAPLTKLDLSPFIARPVNDSELASPASPPSQPEAAVDSLACEQLMSMGFSKSKAEAAIRTVGSSDVELAMNWLIEHLDDPEPMASINPSNTANEEPSKKSIAILTEAGFSRHRAQQALLACDLSVERAFDYLLSHADDMDTVPSGGVDDKTPLSNATSTTYDLHGFISHKGPSIHCGHYVAHVWKGEATGWILFNDERVARLPDTEAATEAAKQAYLYVYVRRNL